MPASCSQAPSLALMANITGAIARYGPCSSARLRGSTCAITLPRPEARVLHVQLSTRQAARGLELRLEATVATHEAGSPLSASAGGSTAALAIATRAAASGGEWRTCMVRCDGRCTRTHALSVPQYCRAGVCICQCDVGACCLDRRNQLQTAAAWYGRGPGGWRMRAGGGGLRSAGPAGLSQPRGPSRASTTSRPASWCRCRSRSWWTATPARTWCPPPSPHLSPVAFSSPLPRTPLDLSHQCGPPPDVSPHLFLVSLLLRPMRLLPPCRRLMRPVDDSPV